jgi:hypothetical protein
MSQSGSYQDAKETIKEKGLKQLVLDFLLAIELAYQEESQCKTYQPAESVPAKRTYSDTRIPSDIQYTTHISHSAH